MTTPATVRPDRLRERYLGDSVVTASPARLVTMLYDRLVLDLDRGIQALSDPATRGEAARPLRHAQDIVLELRGSLDLDVWPEGVGLAELYDFLVRELLLATLRHDAAKVTACRDLVAPLRDSWHDALIEVTTSPVPVIPSPRAAGE